MKLFVFTGETSGDLHGEKVISALKALDPTVHCEGVAGPKMRNLGIKGPYKMEDFQVMGFTDVLKNLPDLYNKFFCLLEYILRTNPDGCLFIDYPGFNLRMAKKLRERGYKGKIIHFICPSVWAWGKKRIEFMAKYHDLLLTIYPFEAAYFAHTSLPVHYIGNPLVDTIEKFSAKPGFYEQTSLPKKPLIALFPGSRKGEIERNLLTQLKALEIVKKSLPDYKIALSVVSPKLQNTITDQIKKSGLKLNSDIFLVPNCYNYELMQEARVALAKSGTITLELALFKKPTVVVYGLSFLNQIVAKYLLKLNLPHYCIVNILRGKTVFPELIQEGYDPETIAKHIVDLELKNETREKVIKGCEEVLDKLGRHDSGRVAAEAIYAKLVG